MADLENYYNKFNEDKRLLSRHGQVEFFVTMEYIHKYLDRQNMKILDVGAGTGRYSIALAKEGHQVTAIELCKSNIGKMKVNVNKEKVNVDIYQGNALNLKKIPSCTYDVTLLLGPMYHLHSLQDKVQVLLEAKRVTKHNGIIIVGYLMNEYCVISYGFKDNNIKECLKNGILEEDTFHSLLKEDDLYDYVRVEDIYRYSDLAHLKREELIGVDGPTDYMRNVINEMDEENFSLFKKYCLAISSRQELIGASSHTIDILRNV